MVAFDKILSIAGIALVLASCAGNAYVNPDMPEGPGAEPLVYVSLSARLPMQGKAHIDAEADGIAEVVWDDDDVIALYDGSGIRDFTIKPGTNNGKTAVFEGFASPSAAEYRLAYPRSAVKGFDDDGFILSIPDRQFADGCKSDKSALTATAAARPGSSFVFTEAAGLFAVPVGAEVEKIVLSTRNSELISGETNTIVFFTNRKEETYYIAAAPNVYLGLRIFAVTSSGKSYMLETPRLFMLDAGHCIKLGSSPMPLDNPVTVIHDENSLKEFLASSTVSFTEDVYMVSDVRVSGAMDGASGFGGKFHGNGHIVSGWRSSAPMFMENRGSVSDLEFSDDCVFSMDLDTFGTLAAVSSGDLNNIISRATVTRGASAIEGPLCFGGIVGYSSGPLSGCANFGPVSVTSGGAVGKSSAVGGIAAYVSAPVTGCINEGDVSLSGRSFSDCAYPGDTGRMTPCIGGLVACAARGAVLDGCENRGRVTFDFSAVNEGTAAESTASFPAACTSIGGIVGSTCANAAGCTNSGDITVSIRNGDPGAPLPFGMDAFAGGIAGTGTDADYTHCVNSGRIVFYSDAALGQSGAGGIVACPGAENAAPTRTSSCTNAGDISLLGPICVRAGGIQGSTGNIETCGNSGILSLGAQADSHSAIGGIAGFHSPAHSLTACISAGDVLSEAPAMAGGLVGNVPNVSGRTGGACEVDCLVKNLDPSGLKTGMIAGFYDGTAAVTFGTHEGPITLQGRISLDGADEIAITASNYEKYLSGSANSTNKIYYTQFAPMAEGTITYSDGKPAAGITVSDGFNVVYTDSQGRYSISTGSDTRYIYFSYPSDAVIEKNEYGCPAFFTKYTGPGTYDFTLTRQAVENSFRLIAMADPQSHYAKNSGYNKIDIARFGEESVPAVNAEIAASSVPCYGVTLGDIVNTVRESDSSPGMTQMREKFSLINMPVFQTMGNHDHTFWYGSSNPLKTDAGSSTLYLAAQRTFEDCFGPVNLSFNRGKVHVVCMRNINYDSITEPLKYHAGFTAAQYSWLEADLANVPSDYMVILCVHIPVNDSSGGDNLSNVLRLIGRFPNSRVLSGHTHFGKTVYNVLGAGVDEFVHPAVCGMWWTSKLNGDGVPNCYVTHDFDGNALTNSVLRGVNENMNDTNYQMRIYRGNLLCGGYYGYFQWPYADNTLMINVFNGSSRWTVKVYEDGQFSGYATLMGSNSQTFPSISPGQVYAVNDKSSQDWWTLGYYKGNQGRSRNSTDNYTSNHHMFKYVAKSPSSAIMVEATDPYGNTYTCTEVWANGFTYPSYIAKP